MTQEYEQLPDPQEPKVDNLALNQNANWTERRFGRAVASTFVGLELSPANELVRIALFGAAQATTHSPALSALTLGVSTFAIEGTGAYVTADLLDSSKAKNLMQKMNDRIKKSRITSKINTDIGSEAGLAMILGVPATMVVKQAQSPERTRKENRQYGLRMSLGVAAVLGTEGFSLSETISHPSLKNGLITAAAVGLLAGGVNTAKNKLTNKKLGKSQKNQNKSELLDNITNSETTQSSDLISLYETSVRAATIGPQIEGLSHEEIQEAIKDPRTKYVGIKDKDTGLVVEMPFIAPIEYAGWLNKDFFEKRGYHTLDLYYCLLPQKLLSENVDSVNQRLDEIVAKKKRGLSVVIDYPDNSEVSPGLEGIDHRVDDLLTLDGTPAATYHYSTKLSVKRDEMAQYSPDPNIKLLDSTNVESLKDRIWEIYSTQFQNLVDEHPILGALTKEQLIEELKSANNHIAGYFDENGRLQGFGNNVDDLSLCPWLNEEYFLNHSEELPIIYQPAIVTSAEYSKPIATKLMKFLLKDRFETVDSQMLTFECSNKSATYIPRLVARAISQSGFLESNGLTENKHFYKVINFSPKLQANTSSGI